MSPNNDVALKIAEAIQQAIWPDIMLIAGKHIQRQNVTGARRFLPGKSKETLLADVAQFLDHVRTSCRGVGFSIRCTETNAAGVEMNLTTHSNFELGACLKDTRSIS